MRQEYEELLDAILEMAEHTGTPDEKNLTMLL